MRGLLVSIAGDLGGARTSLINPNNPRPLSIRNGRVACATYHKFEGKSWELLLSEFCGNDLVNWRTPHQCKSSLDVKIRFHSGEKLVLRFYDEAAKLVTNKGLGNFPNTDEMNFAAVLGRFLGKVDIQKEDPITFEKFIEEFEEKEKPQKGFDDMDTIEQYLLGRIHVEEEELLTWLPGLIPTKTNE